LIDRIKTQTGPATDLPSKISVFGVSYLPPFYLEAFAALSGIMAVHIFVLNPCREYWGDIASESEIHRTIRRQANERVAPETLYLESGNRLLASLGSQGRDFLNLISELNCQWIEHGEALPTDTLLGHIQSDIFYLRERTRADLQTQESSESGTAGDARWDPADDSIQIHSCHSPMREIEVLYDRLLKMLAADPDLTAGDIVVMAPDIELYAPYIQAVFDTQTDSKLKIPFGIADRTVLTQSRLMQTFLALLNIKQSRFTAGHVVDLLQAAGIKEKFDLADSDIDVIVDWIEDLNIRWGTDAGSRSRLQLPEWPENTWQKGIDRLLLGYALPPEQQQLYRGILPYEAIDAADARRLAALLQFIRRLFDLSERLEVPRTLQQWRRELLGMLNDFIESDGRYEKDLQILREVITRLGRQQDLADYDGKVEFEIINASLQSRLQRHTFETGFLSGGVTFCAMLPMRSIPFKVICLVGMNSDSYPRDIRSPGFDLIRRHPRAGDRQRRNDDKYLFLEALLSARQRLYLSYVGQDITDNTRRPPSVLVSELLAYIEQNHGRQPDSLIMEHPLHGFSARYFDPAEPGLFSFSKDNYLAAQAAGRNRSDPLFFDKPLEQAPPEWRRLEIEQLSRFFINPARELLQNRLDLYLDENRFFLPDSENFTLTPLDRFAVEQDLLDEGDVIRPYENLLALQKAKGRLPAGRVAEVTLAELYDSGAAVIARGQRLTAGGKPHRMDIDLPIGDFHLSGRLTDLYPGRWVRLKFGPRRSRHVLAHWVQHLALCAAASQEKEMISYLLCADADLHFKPVQDPSALLGQLLALFWEGMHQPLPFFPETSLSFARQIIIEGKSQEAALPKARVKWQGTEYNRGEGRDAYFQQCFGKRDPLDERFAALALEICRPLLAHMEEGL
jgi:exodeoxyribonuclease V gamma subunit